MNALSGKFRKRRINLIPKSLRPSVVESPEVAGLIGLIAVVFLYVGSSSILVVLDNKEKKAQMKKLSDRNQKLSQQIVTLSSKQVVPQAKNSRYKSVQELLSKKFEWSEVFKELSVLIPKNVWLREMASADAEKGKTVFLRGEAVSQRRVASFFSSLEGSYFFKNVMIQYSEKVDSVSPIVYRFEFKVPLSLRGI